MKRYKSALADEIEPVITELIERAEQGLSALEKKEHTLQTKVMSKFQYICTITSSHIHFHRLKMLNQGLEMLLELVLLQSTKLAVFSN